MSIDSVRARLRDARSVTVLTGAGISTDSGIPDYRGPSGAWTTDPDAAKYVDIDHYLGDPDIRRRSWQRRAAAPLWSAEPNDAHRALTRLENAGRLRAIVTQNIDGLHQRAGAAPGRVIELHGSVHGVVCVACGDETPTRSALDRVAAGEPDPACAVCGGILKTTTVFFGETLDRDVLVAAAEAAAEADVLLVVGTSLTVHPAAGLVDIAVKFGADVVICNAQPTPYDDVAVTVLRDPIGEVLPAIIDETP